MATNLSLAHASPPKDVVETDCRPNERHGDYEILRNIPPIPNGAGREPKYPFAKLAVGDAFKARPDEKNKVSGASCAWARRHNPSAKFSTKLAVIDGEHVVLCRRDA